mmetsp:Transcript_30846/g.69559  ORF Transcript_30846/g.69559 Transcript_30846/m.69559 type:complete len:216 (+) Transcript_30846:1001-1648(+)
MSGHDRVGFRLVGSELDGVQPLGFLEQLDPGLVDRLGALSFQDHFELGSEMIVHVLICVPCQDQERSLGASGSNRQLHAECVAPRSTGDSCANKQISERVWNIYSAIHLTASNPSCTHGPRSQTQSTSHGDVCALVEYADVIISSRDPQSYRSCRVHNLQRCPLVDDDAVVYPHLHSLLCRASAAATTQLQLQNLLRCRFDVQESGPSHGECGGS